MTILSTNQLELMIYCAIEVTKSSREHTDNIYDKNKPTIERNIQSCKRLCCDCMSMKYIVLSLVQAICAVDLFAYILLGYLHVIQT